MTELPEAFVERVRMMLGEAFPAFMASYEQPRHYGLRVNPLKISPEAFEALSEFHLTRVPFLPGAYEYTKEDAASRHPFYRAGLYYLQEPSAMLPADILAPLPQDRVLDLCAAPGGKATALGARLRGKGVLVANDISKTRCRALLHNIEQFGITNAVVTNAVPSRLTGIFAGWFDKVLLDAPCSGEGMFRKDEGAVKDWSVEKSRECAAIQKDLVVQAADMLKAGGMMVYSTCTFSTQENEEVIRHLLRIRPEMTLCRIPERPGFSRGISPQGQSEDETARCCVRIWPHIAGGEGHFICMLKKEGTAQEAAWDNAIWDVKEDEAFRKASGSRRKKGKMQNRKADPQQNIDKDMLPFCPEGTRIVRQGDVLFAQPSGIPELPGINVLRSGLMLGQLRKDRFEPSQSCALAMTGKDYPSVINFPRDDPRLPHYLRGETVQLEEMNIQSTGAWQLVCVEGYPLGWGKAVGGILKNKLPAGWRELT